MLKKTVDYILSCQYLPEWLQKALPWDTEIDAKPQAKKAQALPVCRHCGLCMTSDQPCPAMPQKKPRA